MERIVQLDKYSHIYLVIVLFLVCGTTSTGAWLILTQDYEQRINDLGKRAMDLSQTIYNETTKTFEKYSIYSREILNDESVSVTLSDAYKRMNRIKRLNHDIIDIYLVSSKNQTIYSTCASPSCDVKYKGLDTSNDIDDSIYIVRPPVTHSMPLYRERYIDIITTYHMERKNIFYVIFRVKQSSQEALFTSIGDISEKSFGLFDKDGIIQTANTESSIGKSIAIYGEELAPSLKENIVVPSIRSSGGILIAYYATPASPLAAYAAFDLKPVINSWRKAAAWIGFALAMLNGLLVAFAVLLWRHTKLRSDLVTQLLKHQFEQREHIFLASIVDNDAAMMVVFDDQGDIITENRLFREIRSSLIKVGDQDNCIKKIGLDLGQITSRLPWREITDLVLNDDSRRCISWSISKLNSDHFFKPLLIAVGVDITEQRDREVSILQSAKMLTLGEMAAGLAHEITQPLAIIRLNLENWAVKTPPSGTVSIDTIVSMVLSQTERVEKIVRHMKIYSRRTETVMSTVDPAVALDGVMTLFEGQILAAGIKLKKEYVACTYFCFGENTLIEQIVLNFLTNARDAILKKRSLQNEVYDGLIVLSLSRGVDQTIEISVSDNGVGFTNALKDKLFVPFFTTKDAGDGTGLGLSLSYGMARNMSGSIRADSFPSHTVFTLILRATQI